MTEQREGWCEIQSAHVTYRGKKGRGSGGGREMEATSSN